MINSIKSPASGTLTLANLDSCHSMEGCTKSRARRSVCFCSQSAGDATIRLLMYSCSHVTNHRKTARFVRLALKVVVQNYGDFVDVILLYNEEPSALR